MCYYNHGGGILKGYTTKKGKAWYVVLDLGRDDEGKRMQKWVSVRKELKLLKPATKRQAEELLINLLKDLQDGTYFEPAEITLQEYLAKWLQEYCKPNLKQTTFDSYESFVRLHLTPTLGKIPLKDLRPTQVQKLYNDKVNDLSSRSVRYMHSILRRALKQAVKWEYIHRNIIEAVTPPSLKQKEKQPWDTNQVKTFLDAAKAERLYPLFLLAIMTGMRRGEILGLKWDDINLNNGIVSIKRSIVRTSKGPVVGEVKTEKSKRAVSISETVIQALKTYRTVQAQELLMVGQKNTDGWVFTREADPRPPYPTHLNKILKRIITQANLPKISFHDLRHTHATMLLSQGVNPKIVQERLGHSNISVTMDVYSHVMPGMQKQAADELDKKLFRDPNVRSVLEER